MIVVDTNVLLDLALPVVDGRDRSPTGGDPLKALLGSYEVHVPDVVIGEVTTASSDNDLLAAAAELVLSASHHVTTHDVASEMRNPPADALDAGENHCIWLANHTDCKFFVTNEMNSANILLIQEALNDQNLLTTGPKVLCELGEQGVLDQAFVSSLLSYYVQTKKRDRSYVDQLRQAHL